MAIAYEASVSKGGDFASSITQSLNAGTNDNRCVIVFAVTDRGGATTINSATYGGVSMTAHTAFTHSSGYDGRLFYLGGAASGANDVVVTYSDGNTKPKFVAVAYSGVDGTTPVDQVANYAPLGDTPAPSATVTSASGDLVGFICFYIVGTSATPASPAEERFDANVASVFYAFIWDEAGDTSVTIDGTVTGGPNEVWGAAFNINAAAAAGGVSKTNRLLMGVG